MLKFLKEFFKSSDDKADLCQEMSGKGADIVTPTTRNEFRKAEVSSVFSNANARGM